MNVDFNNMKSAISENVYGYFFFIHHNYPTQTTTVNDTYRNTIRFHFGHSHIHLLFIHLLKMSLMYAIKQNRKKNGQTNE